MPVKLNSSGGGSVTLDVPSTASNFTMNLPTISGSVVAADASGNVGIGQTPTAYGATVRTVEAYIAGASGYTLVSAASASVKTEVASSESSLFGAVGTRTNHPLTLKTNDLERARFDTSGNFQFNSGYGSVATAFGCRAWVNFNGTGTVAIRGSGNVSSITDNGVGDYTVNFTTAMPDVNYSVAGTGTAAPGSYYSYMCVQTRTTGNVRMQTMYGHSSLVDSAECAVAIFR